MSSWNDERKAKAVKLYQERNPTAENSMEIVSEVAEELSNEWGETISPNGLRMILIKAEAYIKKDPGSAGKSTTTKSAGTKVSKEAAHAQLAEAIEKAGKDVDTDIISKLTGKAALYFVGVLSQ